MPIFILLWPVATVPILAPLSTIIFPAISSPALAVIVPVTSQPLAIFTLPEISNPPEFSCILASWSSDVVLLKSINAPPLFLEISIELSCPITTWLLVPAFEVIVPPVIVPVVATFWDPKSGAIFVPAIAALALYQRWQ